MRDRTKVIIGFGSIWGLWAFGILFFSAVFMGTNDSGPEIIAFVLYGLTIPPACILAIWFRQQAAIWLIVLSVIAASGFIWQTVGQASHQTIFGMIGSGLNDLLITGIPAHLGGLLLRSEPS